MSSLRKDIIREDDEHSITNKNETDQKQHLSSVSVSVYILVNLNISQRIKDICYYIVSTEWNFNSFIFFYFIRLSNIHFTIVLLPLLYCFCFFFYI